MNRVNAAMQQIIEAGKLKNILSIHSKDDPVVTLVDSHIGGATNKLISSHSHAGTIMKAALTQGHTIAQFIKA